jgi:hypothetical protein
MSSFRSSSDLARPYAVINVISGWAECSFVNDLKCSFTVIYASFNPMDILGFLHIFQFPLHPLAIGSSRGVWFFQKTFSFD